MDMLLFAAHNTVLAAALALLVYGLTKIWRHPPVAHLLWVLVLVKLVTPPILPATAVTLQHPTLELNGAFAQADKELQRARHKGVPTADHDTPQSAAPSPDWHRLRPALLWIWLSGIALSMVLAVTRIVRFKRRLRGTLPASMKLKQLTHDLAKKLGVKRVPDVRYAELAAAPLVWCLGRRATIVLPTQLRSQLDDRQLAMVLAHELAHLRRHDHWVRIVELIVSVLYWWNPLLVPIRRRLHEAEELCCDAWVRSVIPHCVKEYAEVVLTTAETLGGSPARGPAFPASPFLHSLSLKERINMILESQFTPQLSRRSICVMTLFALLILPVAVQLKATTALANENEERTEKPVAAARTAFPYQVQFEQGVTKFADGDDITILEIRGTAETFIPGHIYWIRGTYSLNSHDQATLAAYTTAKHAADAKSRSYKVQLKKVDQGQGSFTLFLPMRCEGWPHVSFYADGPGIGGNYFGTGDSVLRQWWN